MAICPELQQQEVIVTSPIPTTIAFERILIPTDFSDASQRALEYAEIIARQCGSHLLLAHVNEPVNMITLPENVWTDQRRAQEQIEQQLDQMGAELRSNGFQAETVSVTGLVASELLSLATRENIDLIVVGTHGRSGVDRFLLGSDAETLLRRAVCPVFVVGPEAPASGDGAWSPKEVVCASSLDLEAAPVVAYAYRLACQYDAAFTLFHVEAAGNEGRDWPRFEEALTQILSDKRGSIHSLWREFSKKTTGLTIVDFAKERHSDLIIMGAHSASAAASHLLRGVAPQVFAEAPCPIMILHLPYTDRQVGLKNPIKAVVNGRILFHLAFS
jgi:nucleotide-binding universal stress UspA family protein